MIPTFPYPSKGGTINKMKVGESGGQKAVTRRKRGPSRRSNIALIVKTGNNSYSETLKEVKKEIQAAFGDIEVNDVRKTYGGDLPIVVKDENELEKTRQIVENEVKAKTEVRGLNKVRILHVMRMDATITTDELREAIAKQVSANETATIEVKSMRSTQDGNTKATVAVDLLTAEKLLREGRVKVGWMRCRVKERIEIQRCYRCQEFGHNILNCRGVDRGNCCVRCRETGHVAKDCDGQEFCVTCGEEGHQNNSTWCPAFRRLLGRVGRERGYGKGSKAPDPVQTGHEDPKND